MHCIFDVTTLHLPSYHEQAIGHLDYTPPAVSHYGPGCALEFCLGRFRSSSYVETPLSSSSEDVEEGIRDDNEENDTQDHSSKSGYSLVLHSPLGIEGLTIRNMEAAGLASSIITFIDFSYKLINGSVEIYQRAAAGSAADEHIGKIVHDLENITQAMSKPSSAQPTPHELALSKLAGDCNALSNELIAVLKSLEPKKSGNKALRSLEASWKALREEGKITKIEQKLSSYKLHLLLRLNLMLCESGRDVGNQVKEMQESHSGFFSKNIQELQSVQGNIKELESKVLDLVQEVSNHNSSNTNMEHFNSLGNIYAELTCIKDLLAALPQRTPLHFRILDRLNFDKLYFRVDSVQEGQFEHFLSHLGDSQLAHSPRDNKEAFTKARDALQFWLENGSVVFHISGKPGSGKSTLMKLLSQNNDLHGMLKTWAGDKKLVIANFFFWNAGSPLQKSLEGLYRSLLFEVLRQCPDLTERAFPQHENQSSSYEQHASPTMSYRPFELRNAMKILVESFTEHSEYRLCLFIDGLDELDGQSRDYLELAKQLREWAENHHIRICASSRPYQEFHSVFDKIARINLHELTSSDIHSFSRKTLDDVGTHLSSEYIGYLANLITNRAEGVFLWAHLVVRDLSEGILYHHNYETLMSKINETPKDLMQLFLRLFQSISTTDRTRAYRILLLFTANLDYPFNAIMVSWMDDLEDPGFPYNRSRAAYTDEKITRSVEYAERQLKLLCKGLLVLKNNKDDESWREFYEFEGPDIYFQYRVEFFHRSALDFVRQPETLSAMQQHLGDRAPESSEFTRLLLAQIKFARTSHAALKMTSRYEFSVFSLHSYFEDACLAARESLLATGECENILQQYRKEPYSTFATHPTYSSYPSQEAKGPHAEIPNDGIVLWGWIKGADVERGKMLSLTSELKTGKCTCMGFSFLHYSVYRCGLPDFILKAVMARGTELSCPHLCLILSAVWNNFYDADLADRLLNQGVRLSKRIVLYDVYGEHRQYVPGWVAFLVFLGNDSARNWHKGWDHTGLQDSEGWRGPYSALEVLLRRQSDSDVDVRMEFQHKASWERRWDERGPECGPFTLTLGELVLDMMPPNMDILLRDLQARRPWTERAGSVANWALSGISSCVAAFSGAVSPGFEHSPSNAGPITDPRKSLPISTWRDANFAVRRMWVGGTMYEFGINPGIRVY